jgi:hypothetical protein
MSSSLEVSFNSPQCGWMSVGFAGGGQEFHTTTAHAPHEFALSELLQILTSLLDASSPRQFLLRWNRDPEAFDLHFSLLDGRVTLEIYQFPTDERETELRESVFSYTGAVREFCRAFAITFEQLYTDRDADEFEFNWRQPFPIDEYRRFESAVAGKA